MHPWPKSIFLIFKIVKQNILVWKNLALKDGVNAIYCKEVKVLIQNIEIRDMEVFLLV
jgi:hypothetical protein